MQEVSVSPLTDFEKQGIVKSSFGELSEISSSNILDFLKSLQIVVKNYLKEYEENWAIFNAAFNLSNKINTIQKGDNLNSAYAKLRNQQGPQIAVENFIKTLEKGVFLLEYIRNILTNQTIETNFTVKGSDGEIYLIDKKNVSYKLVLSTFGSSGNNFVSLAYDIDIKETINSLKQSLSEEEFKNKFIIRDSDIYKRIMEVKDQYLEELKEQHPERTYIPRYDSTDAEIFNLMKQRLENQDIISLNKALTKNTYRKMRKTMGGRGGYRTTATQLGDVGLIQDKLVTQQQNRVNFARQTLVYNRFKSLEIALNSQDINSIKNTFLKIFTEKQSRVGDSISKMVNKEATELIKSLFAGL